MKITIEGNTYLLAYQDEYTAVFTIEATTNIDKPKKSELELIKQPTKDLSGYRIKVTPDTKDEIEGLIRKEGYDIGGQYFKEFPILLVGEKLCVYVGERYEHLDSYKPMYLHNHELVFKEPNEECEHNHNITVRQEIQGIKFCPYCGKQLVAPTEKE